MTTLATDPDTSGAPIGATPVIRSPTDLGFEHFFVAQHDTMVRALSITLGDDELGRDAASEGFARALQRWGTVSQYANPSGWVYRVGLNWATSRRRKTVREIGQAAARGEREPTVDATEPDVRIASALLSLSIDHRAVVVGRFYLDLSEAELAESLGIRPGTVKSRLSRALDDLARHLGTR